ncbi:MAG: energy-coupled thiamine transporter ThiT [Ruminococcus sp.]|nr:energy-coupled thiamine transporter ThiT [Ruminococcus sp.]
MSNSKTKIMVEGAIMLALSIVLSFIKFKFLPFGGSITVVSMLPIMLFSIRHGLGWGMFVSVIYSLFQMFIDLGEVMSWGLSVPMLIGCLAFDYIIAFSVLGLAGMFKNKSLGGNIAGMVIAMLLRYISHILSGVVVFKSAGLIWDIDIENSFLYSSVYNAAYMLPEIVFTIIVTVILFTVPQTKKLLLTTE